MRTHHVLIGLVTLVIAMAVVSFTAERKDAAASPFTVGFVLPVTGDFGVYGEAARNAGLLAVEELRQQGMSITAIVEDDRLDSKLAVSAAKKLLEVDKVDALVSFSSGETLAVCPLTRAAGVILLTEASSPEVSKCGGYTFRNFPSDVNQGRVLADRARVGGYEKVFVAYLDNDYGAGLKQEFERNFTGEAMVEAFAVQQRDFRTLVAKIKQYAPDLVVLISYPTEGSQLLTQMDQLGLRAPIIGSESTKDDSIIPLLPKGVAERFAAVAVADYTGIEAARFRESYEARFGKKPAVFADYVYDNVMLLGAAIKRCPSAEGRPACLATQIRGTTFVGATGKITFDAQGDVQAKPYDLFRITGNTFVVAK